MILASTSRDVAIKVKVRVLISTLLATCLVVGSVVHASTHEVLPDSSHELVECLGCHVVLGTADSSQNLFYFQAIRDTNITSSGPAPVSPFTHYVSRAPPRN